MIKHILLVSLFFVMSAHGAIYEQKKGDVTVFTDSPTQGGKEVQLPKESGFQRWQPEPKSSQNQTETHSIGIEGAEQQKEPYRKIEFSNIEEQQTFHNERRIPNSEL